MREHIEVCRAEDKENELMRQREGERENAEEKTNERVMEGEKERTEG